MARLETFNSSASTPTGWPRPYDWLPMPTVTAADQKFIGLIGIWDTGSEYLAFTATGNFTVDWGDGSATENIASGVTAQHQYTYSSAGNLSALGYKQALVTVTPQAGQNLDSVNIDKRHSSAAAQLQTSPWLDIVCSCRAASTGGLALGIANIQARALQRVVAFNGGSRTDYSNFLRGASALQSVTFPSLAAMTNGSNFLNSAGLQSVSLPSLAAMTNGSSFFNTSMLRHIGPVDMSGVTTTTNMFLSLYNLARMQATGLSATFSLANCNLGVAACNEVYTNLATVSGKTLTMTGNPGSAGSDTTIATAKGWTIVP